MRSPLALLVLWLAAIPALAETCRYVDKDGRTIYSNVTVKNARKVVCFQPPAPLSPESAGSENARKDGRPSGASDASRARVEPPTQRKRDDDRRRILEEELAREQQGLDEARKALAEQEAQRFGDERNYAKVLDRLKPYQEAVSLHEKNVASLKQEMANLR
jgi:hypothetical protein